MSDDNSKIVLGPGRDRWPGSPHKTVDNGSDAIALASTHSADIAREEKQKEVLRLRVISAMQRAIQMGALRFLEVDIREMFEEAVRNVRNRNGSDHS